MSPQEVLLAAADLLEKQGLAKERYALPTGEHCCWGAMNVVVDYVDDVGDFPDSYRPLEEAAMALVDYLGLVGVYYDEIVAWSDAPERTAAEVIATLRAVALEEGK